MEQNTELTPEEFNYVSGQNGLNAYALRSGPPAQACPHMQGSAFYQLIDTPQVRQCQACRKMWYCSPECQKDLWRTHLQTCVSQYAPLPMFASSLRVPVVGYPMPTGMGSFAGPSVPGTSQPAQWAPGTINGFNLDVSHALRQGIANSNALGKKAVYDQLTPAMVALFGRHAPASQRLIWCDNRSNDEATKRARESFKLMKTETQEMMKYAHSKFISTRMRGALVFNLDVPHGGADYMLGNERFNWLSYADAQMTLSVKLQETIRAYDPSKGFVVIIYALSPDQASAALWCWTYTTRSRADPPDLRDLRIEIRRIMNDTKRGEKHMYTINKDQNDL